MNNFSIEIPENDPLKMGEFQNFMDEYHQEVSSYICELAKELGVSEACASDVWYFRTRSRWNSEDEKLLILLHEQGNPPNMCEFP